MRSTRRAKGNPLERRFVQTGRFDTPAAKAHNNRRFPALSDVTLETLSR